MSGVQYYRLYQSWAHSLWFCRNSCGFLGSFYARSTSNVVGVRQSGIIKYGHSNEKKSNYDNDKKFENNLLSNLV